MTTSILIPPLVQFIDANGEPLVGGKVYSYIAGTSTRKDTYTDSSGAITNPWPVILDSAGRASIWTSGIFKINVTDANDVQIPGYPIDYIYSYSPLQLDGLLADVDDLNSTITSAIVVSDDYLVQYSDRGKTILVNANSSDVTISLPATLDATNRFKICIKKVDFSDNLVNITTNGSETIDNLDGWTLYDYGDFIEVLCDGNNWQIVSSQTRGAFINITSNLTVDLSHNGATVFCDISSSSLNITLPSIATIGSGFDITFVTSATSANSVTLNANAPDLINGKSTYILGSGYQAISLKTNLAKGNWFITNSSAISSGWITGDVKFTVNVPQSGWIDATNDNSTIGDSASGATFATNACHDLFIVWYNNYPDSLAPVSGGRSGNAETDWGSHKKMRFPQYCCRAIAPIGSGIGLTPQTLGNVHGEENHQLSVPELPHHHHPGYTMLAQTGDGVATAEGRNNSQQNVPMEGSDAPHNNMQPTTYLYLLVKL